MSIIASKRFQASIKDQGLLSAKVEELGCSDISFCHSDAVTNRGEYHLAPLHRTNNGLPNIMLQKFANPKGTDSRQLDFHLYAVTAPDDPRTSFGEGRSGFEMALA